MAVLSQTGLEYVEEGEAHGEIEEIYDDVRRTLQLPSVPNAVKVLSAAPSILSSYWAMYKILTARVTLPPSLVSMIHFSIASSNDCTYCASWNELSCRTFGIDEATLEAMAHDLPNLDPARVRAIIQFSLKMVHAPKAIEADDFESLRSQGLTEEEIMEIIMVASIGQLHDILADTLKLDVDSVVVDGLEQTRAA